jgi:hypothetical protein
VLNACGINSGRGSRNQKKCTPGRKRAEIVSRNPRNDWWRNNLFWFLLVSAGSHAGQHKPQAAALGLTGQDYSRIIKRKKKRRPAALCFDGHWRAANRPSLTRKG